MKLIGNKFVFGLLTATVSLSLLAATTSAFSVLAMNLIIDESSSFVYNDANGYSYKCYDIDGENSVAIAWNMDPSNTPNNLIVPSTFEYQETTYTIKALAKGAFRYCDFETITLPDTIQEIREEAFAYCQNLTTFSVPYLVSEIAPSTFLDCRSLSSFLYKSETGLDLSTNNTITVIGDHAFDSCISLVTFEFPNTLTRIGRSAFQKCRSFTRLYLPSKKVVNEQTINNITIESYAFSDCYNLVWFYFEENLIAVEDYAFTACNTNLVFHYGHVDQNAAIPSFSTYWRRKRLSSNKGDVYGFESTRILIYQHDDYPGLRYTIDNADVYLDSQRGSKTIKIINGNEGAYASVYQWVAPQTSIANYYNVGTGALEIPGSLTHEGTQYPLKVIKAETFSGKTEIRSIKFNDGLVQICNKAFYGCNQIKEIDFDGVTTLKEIGNGIFIDAYNTSATNEVLTSLALPASVECYGKYAFYGFRNVSSLSFVTNDDIAHGRKPHVKVFGGYSFSRIGEKYNAPLIDIVLPNSLDDEYAKEANINFDEKSNWNRENWGAVGPFSFGAEPNNQYSCIRTVTMDNSDDTGNRISMAPNAFMRCKHLVRFVANDNFCLMGADAFKECPELREVFLTTARASAYANSTGKKIVWGTKDEGATFDQSIVSGTTVLQNLVIYLDGETPGDLDTLKSNDVSRAKWNAETAKDAYSNQLGPDPNKADQQLNRSSIPTFTNVDFDLDNGGIIYWNPNNRQFLATPPSTASDYNNGVISFVKSKNNNDYTVAKYYYDKKNNNAEEEIDLTDLTVNISGGTISLSDNLKAIGPEAFASNDSYQRGKYFILPSSITKIDERAFYRRCDKNKESVAWSGTRIVTYKKNGVIQGDYENIKATCQSCDSKINTMYNQCIGYCILPDGLEHIGRNAFYNNLFGSVQLGANVSFIGKSPFFTYHSYHSDNDLIVRSMLENIVIDANNVNFKVENDGLYYNNAGDAAHKTLIYQAQKPTGTLSIATGTKAIGMNACANLSYDTVNLNSELTHIYGGAFQESRFLTTINGGTGLKYIGTIAPNDEIWNDSLPFDIMDFKNTVSNSDRPLVFTRMCAFKGCNKLKTFNLKQLVNLKKIGHQAFYNCSTLEELTGNSDTYSYYTYDSTNDTVTLSASVTKGVLDLSNCTQLTTIGAQAFANDKMIKYAHFPDSNGELYMARDPDGTWSDNKNESSNTLFSNNSMKILMGDNAYDACAAVSTKPGITNHFSNVWFGSNTVYYYAASVNDLLTQNTAVHYWTENPNGGYILFSDYNNALSYFS